MLSYTIWHTQRTGSTWLCEGLAATNVAGYPGEALDQDIDELFKLHDVSDISELISQVITKSSTENGVFGIKQGYTRFNKLIELIKSSLQISHSHRLKIWEEIFPNHRHIFLTRRNKIRVAVSWWKAIQSGEWHRRTGEKPDSKDISDAYNFDAIDHLMSECVMREAGIQSLFEEANIEPLTIVYEDLLLNPQGNFLRVLSHLGTESDVGFLSKTKLIKTSDALSEEWVQRYRKEKQDGWTNQGW